VKSAWKPNPVHSVRATRWGAAGFLFLLPFLFFWRETLGRTTLGDKDVVFWFYPAYKFVAEQLKQGRLPLLTPYLYCGAPLLAEWQAGVFDPLNWIYLLGVTSRTLTLSLQLTFAVALLAMFAYARATGLTRRASVAAAVIYAFSGFMVGRAMYPGFLHIVALAPLVLVFVERVLRTGRWCDAIGGAGIVAWQVFAAHPQPLIYFSLVVCAYALFRCREAARDRVRFLAQCALMYVAGAGLAAVQLLPAVELARESVRREWPYELFTLHSLHPLSLLTTLFPFLHGEGNGMYRLPYWGPYWHNGEAQIYLGVAALSLAAAGALAGWRHRISLARFWSVAAVVGAALALGTYLEPVARALYHVPILNQFRSPNRYWAVVTLAVAVLAGQAVDRLLREESKPVGRWVRATAIGLALACAVVGGVTRWRREWAEGWIRSLDGLTQLPPGFLQFAGLEFVVPIVTGFCGAALLFGFTRFPRRGYAALLALLLADFQLFALFAPINNPAKLETLVGRAMPASLAAEQREHNPIRYHVMLDAATGEFNPFWFYGHEMFTGYDPLLSQPVKDFLGVDEAGRTFNPTMLQSQDRTLDLLNVRYVFVPPGYSQATVGEIEAALADAGRWRARAERSPMAAYGEYRVYENLRAMPRVWLTRRVHPAWEGDQHKLIRGQMAGFDPREAVLVEPIAEPARRWYRDFESPATPGPAGTATILARGPSHLVVETDAAESAVLVVSELAWPGWKMTVDGRPADWHRANFRLRAAPLAAGRHRVEFRYEPRPLKIGAVVTLTTALALLILLWWDRRRR
jgi:Bacterial membrane protein YfhO